MTEEKLPDASETAPIEAAATQASAQPSAQPQSSSPEDEYVKKEPEYSQDFRQTAYCQRCRRDFTLRSCVLRPDTTMTEMHIICPRCKKKLKIFRLKEWYDHYIHNDTPPPKVSDEPLSEDDHHHH